MRPDDERAPRDADPELNAILGALDHPTPHVSAASLAARARTAHERPWLRRAAIVVVALGVAGAAWALPGSPLRAWWDARSALDEPEPAIVGGPGAPPIVDDAPTGGVALDGVDPPDIVFATAPGAFVEVVVVEQGTLTVESFGGTARFGSDPERLRIEHIDAGTRFRLTVPLDADSLEVLIGSRAVWRGPGAGDRPSQSFPLDR